MIQKRSNLVLFQTFTPQTQNCDGLETEGGRKIRIRLSNTEQTEKEKRKKRQKNGTEEEEGER